MCVWLGVFGVGYMWFNISLLPRAWWWFVVLLYFKCFAIFLFYLEILRFFCVRPRGQSTFLYVILFKWVGGLLHKNEEIVR